MSVTLAEAQPQHSEDAPPAEKPPREWLYRAGAVLFLLVILGAYAFVQIRGYTQAYGEGDPDGYLILAKRIAEGRPLAVVDNDPFMYQTHVWVENTRGEIIPKFAPGYPAILAIFYKLGGDDAMFWASPVFGGLTLVGTYLLCRLWLTRAVSLIATASLAMNSTFLLYSSYLLTHATEMCFVVWGMYFLWRWLRDPRAGVASILGILAGLTLGYACTVRHTSALLVVVVVAATVARFFARDKARAAPIVALLIAYAVFPLLMAAYNWRYFGAPSLTGYSFTDEQLDFTWKQFVRGSTTLARGFSYDLLFIVFPLGLLGMLFTGSAMDRILRLLWLLPLYIVYAGYYFNVPNNAYYRFLLPVLPMFTACAFALLSRVSLPGVQRWMLMVAVLVVIVLNEQEYFGNALIGTAYGAPTASNYHAIPIAAAAKEAQQTLTDDAIVIAWPPTDFYVGTLKHFRLYPANVWISEHRRDFQKIPPEWNWQPRQQTLRRRRLADLYMTTPRGDLIRMRDEMIRKYLSEGRQVAYLGPQGTASFGPEFTVKPLKTWTQKGWGGWGIYEIRATHPATAPAPT